MNKSLFVLLAVLIFFYSTHAFAQTRSSLSNCLKAPSAACAKLTNPKSGIVAKPATAQPEVLGASTFKFTRTLMLGSTGTDVQQLQTLLISEGFLKENANGKFDTITMNAVKAFQAKNDITPNGKVGPLTRAALNK
jgi:peptidoglycan hydrolase-like protein with peptidoglycan-binding domain